MAAAYGHPRPPDQLLRPVYHGAEPLSSPVHDSWALVCTAAALSVWGNRLEDAPVLSLAMAVLNQDQKQARMNGGRTGTRYGWAEKELYRAAAAVGLYEDNFMRYLVASPFWVAQISQPEPNFKDSMHLQVVRLAEAVTEACDRSMSGLPHTAHGACWPPPLERLPIAGVHYLGAQLLRQFLSCATRSTGPQFLADCLRTMRGWVAKQSSSESETTWPALPPPTLMRQGTLAVAPRLNARGILMGRGGNIGGSGKQQLQTALEVLHPGADTQEVLRRQVCLTLSGMTQPGEGEGLQAGPLGPNSMSADELSVALAAHTEAALPWAEWLQHTGGGVCTALEALCSGCSAAGLHWVSIGGGAARFDLLDCLRAASRGRAAASPAAAANTQSDVQGFDTSQGGDWPWQSSVPAEDSEGGDAIAHTLRGTRAVPYHVTSCTDDHTGTITNFVDITFMSEHQDKSVDELRWEDYQAKNAAGRRQYTNGFSLVLDGRSPEVKALLETADRAFPGTEPLTQLKRLMCQVLAQCTEGPAGPYSIETDAMANAIIGSWPEYLSLKRYTRAQHNSNPIRFVLLCVEHNACFQRRQCLDQGLQVGTAASYYVSLRLEGLVLQALYPDPTPIAHMKRCAVALLLAQGELNATYFLSYAMSGPDFGVAISSKSPQAWNSLPSNKRLAALCAGDPVLRLQPLGTNVGMQVDVAALQAALPRGLPMPAFPAGLASRRAAVGAASVHLSKRSQPPQAVDTGPPVPPPLDMKGLAAFAKLVYPGLGPFKRLKRSIVSLLFSVGPAAPAGPYSILGRDFGIRIRELSPSEWDELPTGSSRLALCCKDDPCLVASTSAKGEHMISLDLEAFQEIAVKATASKAPKPIAANTTTTPSKPQPRKPVASAAAKRQNRFLEFDELDDLDEDSSSSASSELPLEEALQRMSAADAHQVLESLTASNPTGGDPGQWEAEPSEWEAGALEEFEENWHKDLRTPSEPYVEYGDWARVNIQSNDLGTEAHQYHQHASHANETGYKLSLKENSYGVHGTVDVAHLALQDNRYGVQQGMEPDSYGMLLGTANDISEAWPKVVVPAPSPAPPPQFHAHVYQEILQKVACLPASSLDEVTRAAVVALGTQLSGPVGPYSMEWGQLAPYLYQEEAWLQVLAVADENMDAALQALCQLRPFLEMSTNNTTLAVRLDLTRMAEAMQETTQHMQETAQHMQPIGNYSEAPHTLVNVGQSSLTVQPLSVSPASYNDKDTEVDALLDLLL